MFTAYSNFFNKIISDVTETFWIMNLGIACNMYKLNLEFLFLDSYVIVLDY